VVFAGNVTSKECEYCGAPRQRGGVHRGVERVPVDGVLPFQVEQKAAATALSEWVRSRWFAPNEFLRRGRRRPLLRQLPAVLDLRRHDRQLVCG
jgi:hypothetical protein